MKKFADADYDYVLGGLQMSRAEAQKLEASLETNPNDCLKRLRLMQFYMIKSGEKNAKKNNLAHALWLVKNTPDLPPGMGVWQSYNKEEDPQGFNLVRQEWMKQLQLYGEDCAVIDNAVIFFQMYDKNMAEQLLLKAKQLDPSNPSWSQKLVHVYSMHSGRARGDDDDDSDDDDDGSDFGTIRELENAIEKSKTRSEKLNNTIVLAQFLMGESDVEKRLEVAKRLLDLAQGLEDDPNYGPAIRL